MDVNEILAGSSSKTGNDKTSTKDGTSLGKEDFLKLMIAQLSNQDPMDPLSNEEYIAQMATFSQLEQLTNLNSNFTSFMKGQEVSQYASLIGKNVSGIADDGETAVTGIIDSISFEGDKTIAKIDSYNVPVDTIKEITNVTK